MARIIVGIVLFAAFVTTLVLALRNQARVECEVCVEFAGRHTCRTNWAADRNQAIMGATTAACSMLSSGVTAGIQCSNTPPRSVDCTE
jgi:hypothetical protein